jgi:hypothetical protein
MREPASLESSRSSSGCITGLGSSEEGSSAGGSFRAKGLRPAAVDSGSVVDWGGRLPGAAIDLLERSPALREGVQEYSAASH